jgi:hypothetical protein
LKELVTSIDELTALRPLDLLGCWQLKELPTFIDKLTGCEKLNFSEVELSDEGSSNSDFKLDGDVGIGTLQSQATFKFAEHNTILKITDGGKKL